MTELQKLSLKKLRKRRLPLFVVDRKSKKGGFVIVDAEKYQKTSSDFVMARPEGAWPSPGHREIPRSTRDDKGKIPDYRHMGLLWDRPDLDNKAFHQRLKDENHYENAWAVTRLLERARSEWVVKILTLEELKRFFPKVRLRPPFQEAWSHAIRYWSETPNQESVEDTLINKMRSLVSRNAIEDYVDLYHLILASQLTTEGIIELAKSKNVGIDPLIVGRQIEYIFQAPMPPSEFLIKTNWQDLQLFFKKFQKECFELIRP